MSERNHRVKVGIIGASGYTGFELIRLLSLHDHAEITVLGADRKAGVDVGQIFPHLRFLSLPALQKTEDIDYAALDCVFYALPHGITQTMVGDLPKHIKIIDLSADFRLSDPADYEKFYGHPHQAVDLQKSFVYGLTEYYREEIRNARSVANTGCYVAASLLALLPVVTKKLVDTDQIIIDAKSGVTGAGKSLKEGNLFTEVSQNFRPYGVSGHRHSGEINAELSKAAGIKINPRFTPHLIPQNRGICVTIHVNLQQGVTAQDLYEALRSRYEKEYFVHVAPFGQIPETAHVIGSNFTQIGVAENPDRPGEAVIVSVLDNLVKGASGQAVQNMNVMFGFDENCGLRQLPLYP